MGEKRTLNFTMNYATHGLPWFQKGNSMPTIMPVSDLRNYSAVLQSVASGEPVFLTKNGRGRYVLLDIDDYERRTAAGWLASELDRGWKSGEEEGWISNADVQKHLKVKIRAL